MYYSNPLFAPKKNGETFSPITIPLVGENTFLTRFFQNLAKFLFQDFARKCFILAYSCKIFAKFLQIIDILQNYHKLLQKNVFPERILQTSNVLSCKNLTNKALSCKVLTRSSFFGQIFQECCRNGIFAELGLTKWDWWSTVALSLQGVFLFDVWSKKQRFS